MSLLVDFLSFLIDAFDMRLSSSFSSSCTDSFLLSRWWEFTLANTFLIGDDELAGETILLGED